MSDGKTIEDDHLPYCELELPCRQPIVGEHIDGFTLSKEPRSYDALPRDVEFAYFPPSYYAPGFQILGVYKNKLDFTALRDLFFLEDPDPKAVAKWGGLRKQIPMAETRVTDLPGARQLTYKNYSCRSLVPKSAASWRKSIKKVPVRTIGLDQGYGNSSFVREKITCEFAGCPFKGE